MSENSDDDGGGKVLSNIFLFGTTMLKTLMITEVRVVIFSNCVSKAIIKQKNLLTSPRLIGCKYKFAL